MKNGEIQANGNAFDIIAAGLLNEVYEMDVARYMQSSMSRWS
jgi:ABC-type enterochelin transport system ATPase subunit